MNVDLSGAAKIILYVFCAFIVAINLSLVFALRARARDEAALREKRRVTRPPWASKLDEPTAELSRRVQQLNATGLSQPTHRTEGETPPPTGDTT